MKKEAGPQERGLATEPRTMLDAPMRQARPDPRHESESGPDGSETMRQPRLTRGYQTEIPSTRSMPGLALVRPPGGCKDR